MATQNPYSDSLLADAFRGSLSNLESLGRGFAVAPIGLLGDVEGLLRKGVNFSFGRGGVNVSETPVLPTTEGLLSNIPRVSAPRMETSGMEQLGAAMNPRGPVDLARGAGRLAGSAVNEAMVYGRGPLAAITPQPMRVLPQGIVREGNQSLKVTSQDASEIFGEGAKRIRYQEPNSQGFIDVLQRPDGTASVLGLEVPETARGKGIGQSLQAKVLADFPEMQGQVSSKAAATTAYRLGRRPVGMPNASIEDVFKMIDEDSSVNLVSPKMQNRFGGLLSESAPFQYPQEEAMRLAQQRAALPVEQYGLGLRPDNTTAERAAAMGFDTDLLHGTDQSLEKFEAKRSISKDHGWYGDEGVYLTPDPNTASGYANWKNVGAGINGKLGQELYGQNVMPLVVNRGNVFDYGDAPPLMDREKAKEFSETIKRLGFNTIEVPNKYASPEYAKNYETVILNPDDIRSRFAAFDPFRRNAAIAAATGVAAPNLLAQEQPQSAGLLYPLP